MKKTILLMTALFTFSFSVYAQWVQIGGDIDGEALDDISGFSVSLSSDGSILAVGAMTNDGSGIDAGHVRIYEDNGGTWTQVGTDIDGEDPDDQSGHAVSLSSDGSRVAISSTRNNGINGAFSGHVRIYENNGGTWSQVGDDIDGEAFADESGNGLSLSSDGSIVAIGAWRNSGGFNIGGHVRVYQDSSGTWVKIGADIDANAFGIGFGEALSLSSDGYTIAIGARGFSFSKGQVRILEYNSNAWVQVGADIIGEDINDNSGSSVSLSNDGSIVAIGAFVNDGINGPQSGHVRIYEFDGTAWNQVGADIDGEASGDLSGFSVSLSSDGSIVAIGAPSSDGVGIGAGHVRVYEFDGTTWNQVGANIDGEAAGDHSGNAISLSEDGSIVAIGAWLNEGNGNRAGHVRVYTQGVDGISEMDIPNINIHPNPTTGKIRIDLKTSEKNLILNIYNSFGVLIHTEQLSNVSSFEHVLPETNGLYLVQLVDENGEIRTLKVVKE